MSAKTPRSTREQATSKEISSSGDDFNLRALVRDVVTTAVAPDPRQIAKEVGARIPPEHADAAYAEALAEYVRHHLTTARPRIHQQQARTALSARSAKVARIRDAWRQYLRSAYDTGSGRKWLGDCDADDLIFIADNLERQAREHAAKAAGFRDLSGVLRTHGAAKVADLPDGVLAEYLGGAAA